MAVPCEKLLYPELLSNEELIHIIQERYLRIDNIERFSRHELIELFRNYCIPHGQRKYRDSSRGKVLNKSRRLSPQKGPQVTSYSEISHKLEGLSVINNSLSRNVHSNSERLKPPPDVFSGCVKRIKLDNAWKEVDINKRKMSIDSVTLDKDSPPAKKEKKLITWP